MMGDAIRVSNEFGLNWTNGIEISGRYGIFLEDLGGDIASVFLSPGHIVKIHAYHAWLEVLNE